MSKSKKSHDNEIRSRKKIRKERERVGLFKNANREARANQKNR